MMDGYELRTATAADREGLATLYRRSFGGLLKRDYPGPLLDNAMPLLCGVNPQLIDSGCYYLITAPHGIVVAAGGWSYETPGTGAIVAGHAHIRHFAVDPAHLRLGLGRNLFDACRENAIKASLFECFSTRTAVPFYTRLGFEALGEVTVQMTPEVGFPSVHMINRLAG